MAKKCGVYCIRNKVNDKRYIGQSVNIIFRKYNHFSDLRNNKHHNPYLQNAFNKEGESNFEFSVLVECSIDKLDCYEKYYIEKFDTSKREYGYNLESGGNKNKIIPDEIIEQQAQSKSITSTTTGIRRVSKIKLDSTTQGFTWVYQYREKNIDYKVAQSVNLLEVEKKVKEKGFPWIIVNEEKAKNSYDQNEFFLSELKRRSNTGFFRVQLIKTFYKNRLYETWGYSYYDNGEQRGIGATSLDELKEKVMEKELEWFIVDEKLAKASLKKDKEINNYRMKNKGTTNYYRVSIEECESCKNGVLYIYSYQKNKKRVRLRSTDLEKLEKKVKDAGLVWKVKN